MIRQTTRTRQNFPRETETAPNNRQTSSRIFANRDARTLNAIVSFWSWCCFSMNLCTGQISAGLLYWSKARRGPFTFSEPPDVRRLGKGAPGARPYLLLSWNYCVYVFFFCWCIFRLVFTLWLDFLCQSMCEFFRILLWELEFGLYYVFVLMRFFDINVQKMN